MNGYHYRTVCVLIMVFFVNSCQAPATYTPPAEDTASTLPTDSPTSTRGKDTDEATDDGPAAVETTPQDKTHTSEGISDIDSIGDTPQVVDTDVAPETIDNTRVKTDTPAPVPTSEAQALQETEEVQQTRSKNALPEQNKFYDRDNPAYPVLQKANQAMTGFPLDTRGGIDWMLALRQGLITPRANITQDGDMQRRTDDIIMKQTRNMPYVLFPHGSHTEWLACESCHPKPFVATAGANRVTMNDMYQGKFCGICHDRVAFDTFACERCHSVLHEGSPIKWW